MRELRAEIIIIGGGVGGCAAALAGAKAGKRVILTEETNWIGGQLTSQAVPPDENIWIEQFGSTQTYREFRNRVRAYYRRNYPLTQIARENSHLNPGNGWVSRLCMEPRVALMVLYEMLTPYISSGRLEILLNHRPISAEVTADVVEAITVKNAISGDTVTLTGWLFVDATEMGDLLPMTGTEYVTGAESQDDTGELHAVTGAAQPLNMQAVSYCFALDHFQGEDHTIDKPTTYDFWRDYVPELTPPWPGKLLSFTHPFPVTLESWTRTLFEGENRRALWDFRRIIDKTNFIPGTFESDITLVNYPQIDYFLGPVFEVSDDEATQHLYGAKQLSLSFLYWLQTEAPRPDGGSGYPGLRIRKDVVDTDDGLAKYVYIREARRIRAQFTVIEEHVGYEMRGGQSAEKFWDSVGIGHYNIDLHPSTSGDNYIDVPAMPFQIPLGALLPIRVKNLLPASKNIGTTHITNGCYRLHPVEWNIGEAVGHLAAYSLDKRIYPEAVRTERYFGDYQSRLASSGVELAWLDVVEATRTKVNYDKLPR